MADKQCPECPPEGLPGWMGTYGDMMTLLLCFFVLLFAFSTMDAQKFETMMEAFQGSFGVLTGGKTISPEALITDTRIDVKGQQMRFITLAKEIQEQLNDIENDEDEKQKSAKDDLEDLEFSTVEITRRGLELSFGDDALFASGEAQLTNNSKRILDGVVEKLKGLDNQIVIEGHTDNIPINTPRFPSNWELSTTRATSVLRYLIKKEPNLIGRISAAGYADTKPKKVNDTADNRRANRRVDIIVLKSIEERLAEEVAKSGETID